MSRLLLDTHLLLWALADPAKLTAPVRARLQESEVLVSAASIWEISIKAALGKLKADPARVLDTIEPTGFRSLAITAEHAAAVHRLPPHHRDPFDRMLVAQAGVEDLVLLTNDSLLEAYGDRVSLV